MHNVNSYTVILLLVEIIHVQLESVYELYDFNFKKTRELFLDVHVGRGVATGGGGGEPQAPGNQCM